MELDPAIVMVGRGILAADDPVAAACRLKELAGEDMRV